MWTRNGTDTLIGFIPGADINEGAGASVGGLARIPGDLQTMGGWTGRPALGMYTYPSGGASELWDFQKARGVTVPVCYKAFAIPNGFTIAQVKAGNADAVWTTRAQNMVAEGQADNCIYSPGYEGTGGSFNGSAGQTVDPSTVDSVYLGTYFGQVLGSKNWAYAVSRQIHVMRQVAGWNPWIDLNFSVYEANQKGLQSPFEMVTESYQSIGDELYPQDPYSGAFIASNPADYAATINFVKTKADATMNKAKALGVPIIFGEAAPMHKNDGHAMGDVAAWVQWMSDYAQNLSNNVAAMFLYNGTTSGDTSRCFLYNTSTHVYTKDTTNWPLSSQKIIDLFDPAKFINRTPSGGGGGAIYTQAQLDAAVLAQKNLDATSTGATALATLQTLYDTDHALLLSTQTELQEAYAQIAKAIADYETFIGNFGHLVP